MHDSALPRPDLPDSAPRDRAARPNIALWAMIGIPAATVVASAITLALAYGGAEPQLPERYAWEGAALDRDVARASRARALGLGAELAIAADGRVTVRLTRAGSAAPMPARSPTLHLTHATRPALDRSVALAAGAAPGLYEGRLDDLPPARWLVQLDDGGGEWQLRSRLETPGGAVRLGY
jgi:hypothetical protein